MRREEEAKLIKSEVVKQAGGRPVFTSAKTGVNAGNFKPLELSREEKMQLEKEEQN